MPAPVPIKIPFIGLLIASPRTKPAKMQTVRKQPPALVLREAIARPWHRLASDANGCEDGQRFVDRDRAQSGNGRGFMGGTWRRPSSTAAARLTTPPS